MQPVEKPENIAHFVNQERLASKQNQDFEEMMQKYRAKVNADTSVIVKVKPGKTKRSKEIVQSSDQMYDMLRMLK